MFSTRRTNAIAAMIVLVEVVVTLLAMAGMLDLARWPLALGVGALGGLVLFFTLRYWRREVHTGVLQAKAMTPEGILCDEPGGEQSLVPWRDVKDLGFKGSYFVYGPLSQLCFDVEAEWGEEGASRRIRLADYANPREMLECMLENVEQNDPDASSPDQRDFKNLLLNAVCTPREIWANFMAENEANLIPSHVAIRELKWSLVRLTVLPLAVCVAIAVSITMVGASRNWVEHEAMSAPYVTLVLYAAWISIQFRKILRCVDILLAGRAMGSRA